jgi:hypothetical protein
VKKNCTYIIPERYEPDSRFWWSGEGFAWKSSNLYFYGDIRYVHSPFYTNGFYVFDAQLVKDSLFLIRSNSRPAVRLSSPRDPQKKYWLQSTPFAENRLLWAFRLNTDDLRTHSIITGDHDSIRFNLYLNQ